MKTLYQLSSEITRLTNLIETRYPELYIFLDEDPITLPSMAHIEIDTTILKEYIQSLKQMLKRYLHTHKK
ncbi:hypothetical protein [Zeaxanthinibacter enoshimensis]|uniref:Uncharacterized protein n=1 Tax=Zeaxanthinibacter enoshimensis TaxID=392009 RepID=A0A4R6TNB6_9FLAO|nr:hypothetical protein [Zeaxanthinibacter enoshimensis]TDQ31105.1 hypothetical protein CLV82_1807 [Zeaxanthinibacter enoshimensis]